MACCSNNQWHKCPGAWIWLIWSPLMCFGAWSRMFHTFLIWFYLNQVALNFIEVFWYLNDPVSNFTELLWCLKPDVLNPTEVLYLNIIFQTSQNCLVSESGCVKQHWSVFVPVAGCFKRHWVVELNEADFQTSLRCFCTSVRSLRTSLQSFDIWSRFIFTAYIVLCINVVFWPST
jgi:hypothetical protein